LIASPEWRGQVTQVEPLRVLPLECGMR